MTMTEWIATLPEDAVGNVALSQSGHVDVVVTPTKLSALLANITTAPPTYADLSAMPIASSGGWQPYFDDWKAKGLIQ